MADPPRRVNFFDGLLLSAADLAAEQEYGRRMRYLHNRLHGYGAVCGLEVEMVNGQVQVGTGMGIDLQGREIVVTEPLTLDLDPDGDQEPWVRDLVIAWNETPEGPVPGVGTPADFTRWVERPELALADAGAATTDALTLARLTRTSDGAVGVDTSMRRPFGPS